MAKKKERKLGMKSLIGVGVIAIALFIFGGTDLLDRTGITGVLEDNGISLGQDSEQEESYSQSDVEGYDIPEYNGELVVVINDNNTYFEESDLDTSNGGWEEYSELDNLGRVGAANAMINPEMFPTEDRGSIGHVTPTGWEHNGSSNNERADINGSSQWMYNRSHLIGHQLTGQDDNEQNLMTGTRPMNFPNMENFEGTVKEYIEDTGNHVRYRVTPAFTGEELLARGVFIEAESVENNDIEFNVFLHNVAEGYEFNYNTGEFSATE